MFPVSEIGIQWWSKEAGTLLKIDKNYKDLFLYRFKYRDMFRICLWGQKLCFQINDQEKSLWKFEVFKMRKHCNSCLRESGKLTWQHSWAASTPQVLNEEEVMKVVSGFTQQLLNAALLQPGDYPDLQVAPKRLQHNKRLISHPNNSKQSPAQNWTSEAPDSPGADVPQAGSCSLTGPCGPFSDTRFWRSQSRRCIECL